MIVVRFKAHRQAGISVVELLTSLAIAAMLLAGIQQLIAVGMTTRDELEAQTELNREARFAMARMVASVRESNRLILPLADNPGTTWREHIREQSIPASAPEIGSILATAVLAMSLPAAQDFDFDGFADADNDRDGRLDEDWGADTTNDTEDGIVLIDDDGDGFVDEAGANNDDEDGSSQEDSVNGNDDDGDGNIGEDSASDMNGDGAPGIASVDDDGDGSIDEGDIKDDDEDGNIDEDWLDPVVFYLQGSSLIKRRAVPWDENADTVIDGLDYVVSTIADNVTFLRFERLTPGVGEQLVDITLTLSAQNGDSISLNTQIRVGGGL